MKKLTLLSLVLSSVLCYSEYNFKKEQNTENSTPVYSGKSIFYKNGGLIEIERNKDITKITERKKEVKADNKIRENKEKKPNTEEKKRTES